MHLINDVLDLAKIEADKMELVIEPFSVQEAVEEVTSVIKGGVVQKHLDFGVEVDPEIDTVVLDPVRFRQILYNVLSNAVKFSHAGGRVSVTIAPRAPGDFEIRVQDDGIGIAPEDIPKLFHEFEQLETGSGRRFEGTGLGLALVKALVELHGGSIAVASQLGHGTTLTILLPRRVDTSPERHQENRDELMARILIVEDNASNLKLATVILRAAGFHVVGACDSVEAGQSIAEALPDLILMDLGLPGKDGYAITRELRGQEATHDIPIIAVTSYAMVGDRRRAMEAGCVAYLTKPIDRIALDTDHPRVPPSRKLKEVGGVNLAGNRPMSDTAPFGPGTLPAPRSSWWRTLRPPEGCSRASC